MKGLESPSELPESGIGPVGRVSWGSHFCHFSRSREERLRVLIPYFRAGLASGEACLWLVCGEATQERRALRAAVSDLPSLEKRGQFRFADLAAPPYTRDEILDSGAVIQSCLERQRWAEDHGHTGLRAALETGWHKTGWQALLNHERALQAALAGVRALCLCSYGAEGRDASAVFDLAACHDFVLAQRAGATEVLQDTTRSLSRQEALGVELAQLRRQIDEKTQDLDAALNAREEFLALLGHELRNPLGPLRNAARIIRMSAAPDAGLDNATEIIERHVSYLSRLVDDLLDLGRLTRGTMSLMKDQVQLDGVIAAALQVARPLIEFRSQQLVVSLPADLLLLNADAVRLAQVFSNLLDNAAVYTPKGGKIWLSAECEDGVAAVRIRDNGVGIPPHLLSRIFALFFQGPRRPDRSDGGLGIGLSLVKRLVELHGGTVQALSEGEGRGSEFVVRLPVVKKLARSHAASAPGHPAPSKPRLRLLVVDDHLDSNEMLAQLLTLNGHEVRRVANGPAAIAAARIFAPDAVLIDIGLPGMDGYEVARNLRALETTRRSVLIAVTGYGSSRDMRRSTLAGMDHHLVKPVEPDRLLAILDAVSPLPPAGGERKVLRFGARLRKALSRSER